MLIGSRFGSTAKTDGFFAGYAVYAVSVVLGQSWRQTIVARLVESPSRFGAFNRYVGGVLFLFLLSGVLVVVLREPVAVLLTGDLEADARHTAEETLLILWPALGAQLFAGLGAAMLGALGDHLSPAVGYTSGGCVSILAFFPLEPMLGIRAVPTALLIGTAVTVLPIVVALFRAGWRPPLVILAELPRNARAAFMMVGSSLSMLAAQVFYLVSISVATRFGEGAATTYSYAFFGLALVMGLVAGSVTTVLAGPIAAGWDRTPDGLRPYVDDVFRTGLLIIIPVIAAAAFIGDEIGAALLREFTPKEIDSIVVTFLVLSPMIISMQATTVAGLALLTLGRYGALTGVAAAALALHVALSVGAGLFGSLVLLAAASTTSAFARGISSLVLLHGGAWRMVSMRLIRDVAWLAGPAAAAFGSAALLMPGGSGALHDGAAFLVGLLIFAGAVATSMPTYRRQAVRLVDSLRGRPATHQA